MALTKEQRAKLEELEREERKEIEQEEAEEEERYRQTAIIAEHYQTEWDAKTPQEKEKELLLVDFRCMSGNGRLDDIQRYYFEFEGIAVVDENELAKRMNCTPQTIRNYTGSGIIEVLTTDKAKCYGERRYFDLLKSKEAIEAYKAHYRQQRNETRNAGKQPDRGTDGRFTKTKGGATHENSNKKQ